MNLKKIKLTNEVKAWLAFVVLAFVGSGVAAIYGANFLEVLRVIFGVVYVLFLPGYVIVRCFFEELDWIERFAVSFGLSIAVVVLAVIIANLVFKIPITPVTNFLIILAAMVITLLAKFVSKNKPWKSLKKKHK
ncbi:hypothetical protein DRJ48_01830 [Candidatus Woesearchaeota archaeon]|nr:MAG: hypothetical protein DRJ48_01830 [Candidatus Woesearchaeota archaeon]